jgi:hypothetical protein
MERREDSMSKSWNPHGHTSGGRWTDEYRIWAGMVKRCTNPRSSSYRSYGGRGIAICDRWRTSFSAFFADMGRRPSKLHSIDRINNDGNYEPGNCRWATRDVQAANKRPQAPYDRTRQARGARSGAAKLTDEKVRWALAELARGAKQKDIAVALGVTPTTVGYIARGNSWTHIERTAAL